MEKRNIHERSVLSIDYHRAFGRRLKDFKALMSDSFMAEIDLSFNPDDPMPLSIEDDNHDSERDIPILKELFDKYSFSLPDKESYHFDIPPPSLPPTKPPDGNTEILNIKMMGDISDQK
nr:hypothetical protein [Tanacetum cinerariifolium]